MCKTFVHFPAKVLYTEGMPCVYYSYVCMLPSDSLSATKEQLLHLLSFLNEMFKISLYDSFLCFRASGTCQFCRAVVLGSI